MVKRMRRWTVTGQAKSLWAEVKSLELCKSRHETAGIVREMIAILKRTPRKWRAGRHVDFLIGSYPRVGKDALNQRLERLDDTTSGPLEDQAIFDNNLKAIQLHRDDYRAKLQRMLLHQQGVVHTMIKYLETVENRMRKFEKRGGIPTPCQYLDRTCQGIRPRILC